MASSFRRPVREKTPNPLGIPDHLYYFLLFKAKTTKTRVHELVLEAIEEMAKKDGMLVAPDGELVAHCTRCKYALNKHSVSATMLRDRVWICKYCYGEDVRSREEWHRKRNEQQREARPPTPISRAVTR